jgi:DNA-directed RNA polymerase subunit alpha
MNTLNSIETYTQKNQNLYGSFIIEPLEVGQGITLGNTLRRTLLSDLNGYAITGIRINNLKHEFSIIEGLREDILELILNLKEIVFKTSFSFKKEKNKKLKGFLNIKGPMIVTAGLFQLPENNIQIINPSHYICTIIDNSEFYLEIDIENGKGYKLIDETRKQIKEKQFSITKPTTLYVDALFMPIKKVNYKIKLINDTKGNIKESLFLEIITNGSITPKRSLKEALKIIMHLFYFLFISTNFFSLSEELKKEKLKEKNHLNI